VNHILNGTQTSLVVAAGNWAQGDGTDRTFYSGTFTDSDGDFSHDFTSDPNDVWDRNTLRFSAHQGDQIKIILEWEAWQAEVATRDLDLFLYDAEYRIPLAYSQTQQFGNTTSPVEIISGQLPYTGEYCITIVDRAAKWENQSVEPLSFHLNLFNKGGRFDTVEHHTTCGSVREVATNPDVITVGAISIEDGAVREYSSCGPTASGAEKPNLYAPDGVIGTTYPNFYGTSASAPYAAGAIALLHSLHSEESILALLQGVSTETATPASADSQPGSIIAQSAGVKCTDSCGNPLYRVDLASIFQE